mmetsp:Transcript_13750/g.47956  ORF Transcript_13750/g.47956 Transcript_13750/m.47956 type:complete len:214 (+) Transcript_13750:283-924(+)
MGGLEQGAGARGNTPLQAATQRHVHPHPYGDIHVVVRISRDCVKDAQVVVELEGDAAVQLRARQCHNRLPHGEALQRSCRAAKRIAVKNDVSQQHQIEVVVQQIVATTVLHFWDGRQNANAITSRRRVPRGHGMVQPLAQGATERRLCRRVDEDDQRIGVAHQDALDPRIHDGRVHLNDVLNAHVQGRFVRQPEVGARSRVAGSTWHDGGNAS